MSDRTLARVALGLILLGSILRISAIFNEAWLDEFWPLMPMPAEFKAGATQFDGHSSLYTWIVRSLDAHGFGIIGWRLPALCASIVSLIVLWRILSSTKSPFTLIALLFFATSYPLVTLTTEARGYGPMMCALVLSWAALIQLGNGISIGMLAAFWLTTVAAFLFHPSAVQFIAALGAWTIVSSKRWTTVALIFGPPAIVIGAVYQFLLRGLPSGGGPLRGLPDVVGEAAAVALGSFPLSVERMDLVICSVIVALFALFLIARELFLQWHEGHRAQVALLATGIFLAPALMLFVLNLHSVLARYFLMSMVLGLLTIAIALGRKWGEGQAGKIFVTLCLALYCVGTAYHLTQFFRFGRGQYAAALRFIAGTSSPGDISVSGNHDFRNMMMINYLAPQGAEFARFKYSPDSKHAYTEWYLYQTEDTLHLAEENLALEGIGDYHLAAQFPSAPLSGWSWHLYRAQKLPRKL